MQEGNGDWVDMVRGGVRSGVGAYLPREVKIDLPQDVQSGVVCTHTGKYMNHVAEVALHGGILDARSIFCQCYHANIWR